MDSTYHSESSSSLDVVPCHLLCSFERTKQVKVAPSSPIAANIRKVFVISVSYDSVATTNTMRWTIEKTTKDFENLHQILTLQQKDEPGFISLEELPSLDMTGSIWLTNVLGFFQTSGKSEALDGETPEMNALQSYLQSLLNLSVKRPNRYGNDIPIMKHRSSDHLPALLVLEFIEMMKGLSLDKSIVNTTVSVYPVRPSLHLLLLEEECDTGDIVLFQCGNIYSTLQRQITGSEWDHCGIIVRLSIPSFQRLNQCLKTSAGPGRAKGSNIEVVRKKKNSILCLLECTVEGVTLLPLLSRLKAYQYYKASEYFAVRRLHIFDRQSRRLQTNNTLGMSPDVNMQTLSKFLENVIGQKYELKLSKMAYNIMFMSSPQNRSVSNADGWNDTFSFLGAASPMTSLKATKDSNQNSFLKAKSSEVEESMKFETMFTSLDDISEATDLVTVKDAYFCSELVSAALRAYGIMRFDALDESFWPGSFCAGELLDRSLASSSSFYGGEMLVDCSVLGVYDHAVSLRSSSVNERLFQSSHGFEDFDDEDDSIDYDNNREEMMISLQCSSNDDPEASDRNPNTKTHENDFIFDCDDERFFNVPAAPFTPSL